MRVLLVNPEGPGRKGYIREGRCEQRLDSFAYHMIPISLPSIAGELRAAGHDVRIFDAVARGSEDELDDFVRAFAPELVVFNVATPTWNVDRESVARMAARSHVHRTAIGVHVTALPGRALASSALDSVVRGEPEVTVASLAGVLQAGGDLGTVAGLSWKAPDGVRDNPDRPFMADLDRLAPPARDLLRESDYVLPVINRPYTLVIPSRGCPHRCTYCTAHLYYGRRLRLRSPESIVDEIEAVAARGVVRDVTMWSDTFTLNRDFVLEVCEALIRRRLGIRWMCNSRVDCMDAELARRMAASGCVGISFGIESGSQRMLDLMQKGTTVAHARQAVRAAREAGIPVLAQFILGIPGETPQTIDETVRHAIELDPDYAQFYCAVPMPGTALWDQAQREGLLIERDWAQFEFNQAVLSTPTLSAPRLQQLRRLAYARYYLRLRPVVRLLRSVQLRDTGLWIRQTGRFVRGWVGND